jgi:hypothetical protein
VDRGERGALRVLRQGVRVDDDGAEREQAEQDADAGGTDAAPIREVRRQRHQREEADVEGVEPLVVAEVDAEERRHLDADRGGHRACHHDQQVATGPVRCRRVRATGQHKLLPQSFGVHAGELVGQVVEVAHALHGDQERLVRPQAGLAEVGHRAPKVIFQLVDVGVAYGAAAQHVRAPRGDLRFQVVVAVDRHVTPPWGARRGNETRWWSARRS